MADRRRAAERRGRQGEALAALALQFKGYRVLVRRLRTRIGEVDIVARRGDVFVFVEVKVRPSVRDAIDAVTPRARRRIEAAAHVWASHADPRGTFGRRYDIIAVCPWQWPVHIRDAWRPDSA